MKTPKLTATIRTHPLITGEVMEIERHYYSDDIEEVTEYASELGYVVDIRPTTVAQKYFTERVKCAIMWAVMSSALLVPTVQRIIRLIYGI